MKCTQPLISTSHCHPRMALATRLLNNYAPGPWPLKWRMTEQMSVPVPPLPPPLFLTKAGAGLKIASNKTSNRIKDEVEQCRVIVSNASKRYPNSRWLLRNACVSSRLQGDRPVCGLVALSMAAEMTQSVSRNPPGNGKPFQDEELEDREIEDLICLAQQKCFTQKGEMFSAENLAELLRSFYELNSSVMSSGLEEFRLILSHLAKGNPVLVAYDAAMNHEPCMAQGHRAHWALLTGFLCMCEDEHFDWDIVEEDLKQPLLYHSHHDVGIPQNLHKDYVYLLAKQGKSRHCGVWPLGALHLSNLNLVEFDPLKKAEDYALPVGGIKGGLCGKVILITPSNCAVVK